MSKHFEDARYYHGRAAEHAKEGIKEELEPVQSRVRGIIGDEEEVEQSRLDEILADLKELEAKAEGEAREAVGSARKKVEEYRNRRKGDEEADAEASAAEK